MVSNYLYAGSKTLLLTKLNMLFFQLPDVNPKTDNSVKVPPMKKCLLWNFCRLASPLVPDRALMVVAIKKIKILYFIPKTYQNPNLGSMRGCGETASHFFLL